MLILRALMVLGFYIIRLNYWVRPLLNDNNDIKNASVTPLQYLSHFWRSLEMSLINYKVAGGIENLDTIKVVCPYSHFISKRQSKVIKTF